MKEIKLKARAKINITLDIIGKRDNGYHDVEMIMQTINLYDRLILRKIKKDKILIKTNLKYLPVDERNLVYKIIAYMKETYDLPRGVFVDLHKMIPVAAGMAGGSADAAQTIIGMNKLFNMNLSMDDMMEIGSRFGSDIPYCMVQGTALATGLGENITYLDPFPDFYVLIVKPNFSMSTATVYQNFNLDEVEVHPQTSKVIEAIQEGNRESICQGLVNVLETVTPRIHPEIHEIKNRVRELGAKGVLMSGSGPTVYGLFTSNRTAEKALRIIRKDKNMQFVYLSTIYNRKKG